MEFGTIRFVFTSYNQVTNKKSTYGFDFTAKNGKTDPFQTYTI